VHQRAVNAIRACAGLLRPCVNAVELAEPFALVLGLAAFTDLLQTGVARLSATLRACAGALLVFISCLLINSLAFDLLHYRSLKDRQIFSCS